jgi:hypothetical protein
MPRYFFHIRDGDEIIDTTGTILKDTEEARAHAIIVAGELLKDAGLKFWGGTEWHLWVTDEDRTTVCRLKFSAEDE